MYSTNNWIVDQTEFAKKREVVAHKKRRIFKEKDEQPIVAPTTVTATEKSTEKAQYKALDDSMDDEGHVVDARAANFLTTGDARTQSTKSGTELVQVNPMSPELRATLKKASTLKNTEVTTMYCI